MCDFMKCKCNCHEGGKENDKSSKVSKNSNSNNLIINNNVINTVNNSNIPNINSNLNPSPLLNNNNKNDINQNNSILLNNNLVHPNVTINKSAAIITETESLGSQKKPSILKKTNVCLYDYFFLLYKFYF